MANDKNFLDDLDMELSGDYGDGEGDITLESILAEFKGSAFLDGDKRTPSEELQRRTDEIIRQARQADDAPVPPTPRAEEPEAAVSGEPPEEPAEEQRRTRGLFGRGERQETERDADDADDADGAKQETRRPKRHTFPSRNLEAPPEPAYETAPEIDLSVFDEPDGAETRDERGASSFDDFYNSLLRDEPLPTAVEPEGGSSAPDIAEIERAVENTISAGEAEEEGDRRRRGFLGGIFSGRRDEEDDEDDDKIDGDDDDTRAYTGRLRARERARAEDRGFYGAERELDARDAGPDDGEPEDDGYIDLGPEPDFRTEAQRYAAMVPSLRLRILGVTLVTLLALIFTVLFARGSAPFGVERAATASGVVMIFELIVMALGLDVLIRGFEDILTLSPGTESLVLVSCVMSVADGFVMLLTGNFTRGLPLAVVSCISLLGAMSARKAAYIAYCDSLKSASTGTYYGVAVDYGADDRGVLKKVAMERTGFYAKLVSPDAGETLYDSLAPLLVIVSFVLAFLATVGHGAPAAFTHSFSILTAVCAAFPAAAVFALPFKYAASSLRKAGGALAGFRGAEDIFGSDGALITDQDIFPTGSVTMSGVKIFEGMDPRRVMVDTASLIIASDSGLAKVFEELLKNQGLTRARTDDFACYDGGGIGGVIDGERVLVGTGAFMSLMGLRVPENINTTSSVFTAINDELAGVFSLEYVPANSVQTALVALLGTNTNLMMAVRDFNVTPNTVKQKFKVSMEGVEYLPIETTYDLSQNTVEPGTGISALLVRSGLAPFAEVITRGRLLKLITQLNTCVTAVGTALSVIVMFFLCWSGAFLSASAVNITIFMSVIGIAVYIMSQATRKKMK